MKMQYIMMVLALLLAGCGEEKKSASLEKVTTACMDGLVWQVTPYGNFAIFDKKTGKRIEC